MKRASGFLVLLAAFACLVATPAAAKDMSGRVGVGADSTMGFVTPTRGVVVLPGQGIHTPGLSLIYQASQLFGIQVIANFGLRSGSSDSDVADESASIFMWGVALRGIVTLLESDALNLGVVGGFSFQKRTNTLTVMGVDVEDSASGLQFELGVRPEWFVSDDLSFHTQVGLSLVLLDAEVGGGTQTGTRFHALNADLLGNAGFTFYF